ncbi:phosphotransferase family protein [Sinomonas atrocyanea]|uniref:phosphotransferase family protein n=1 Tax=Sinomonas atrocyanea TaxID=37927 RepID=UPI003D9868CB
MAPRGAILRLAVEAALGSEVEGLEDVRSEALDYDAFLAHRAVRRVRGHARVHGGRRPWFLIEKTTEGPGHADPYLLDNGAREFAAYPSGLLDDLAPRVRPPRLYGSHAGDDGKLVLWLEEVVHDGARPLDATSLLAAAQDLGAMAGGWHRRVPAEPWLFTGWIDRHSQPEAVPAGLATLSADSREVHALLGTRLAAGRALVAAQPRVRDILESLPQTLCHHDAVGANLFVSSGTTVLIDWESVGPGPVGADLASLLFSSVRRGDAMVSVVAAVLESAVSAYTASAREEDPSISRSDIRRGFDAAVALRWKLIADVAASIERGGPLRRGSLPDEPPADARTELVALTDLLLQAVDRVLDR